MLSDYIDILGKSFPLKELEESSVKDLQEKIAEIETDIKDEVLFDITRMFIVNYSDEIEEKLIEIYGDNAKELCAEKSKKMLVREIQSMYFCENFEKELAELEEVSYDEEVRDEIINSLSKETKKRLRDNGKNVIIDILSTNVGDYLEYELDEEDISARRVQIEKGIKNALVDLSELKTDALEDKDNELVQRIETVIVKLRDEIDIDAIAKNFDRDDVISTANYLLEDIDVLYEDDVLTVSLDERIIDEFDTDWFEKELISRIDERIGTDVFVTLDGAFNFIKYHNCSDDLNDVTVQIADFMKKICRKENGEEYTPEEISTSIVTSIEKENKMCIGSEEAAILSTIKDEERVVESNMYLAKKMKNMK